MSVIVDVIINTDQAEQQLQDLQQQIANDLAQGAARLGTSAGQAATATARAAGKNANEEFLRAFDPDKLKAELESAGLGEQEIQVILDTTAAKAETQKLKDTIASAFGEASGLAGDSLKQITAQAAREVDRSKGKVKSVTELVDGVQELKEELKAVGGASNEAAEGIGQLVLNQTVDKFGDIKDIFEKTGVALLGMSESAVAAGVRMADIAEKGAMIGAAFGPTGAAIGLVAGGILGAFNESARAAAEEAKRLTEEIAAQRGVLDSLRAELAKSGTDVGKLTALQEKLTEAQAKAAETEAVRAAAAEKANAEYERQEAIQAALTEDVYEAEAAGGMLLAQSLSLRGARNELTDAEKALADATQISNEQQQLARDLSFQLAQATVGQIKTLKQQYQVILDGGKYAKDSTKGLKQQYAELKQDIDDTFQFTDQLSQSQFDATKTTNGLTSSVKTQTERLKELSELKAEIERRESAAIAKSKKSIASTKEQTEAIKKQIEPIQKQVTEYDKLVALELEHEGFLKRQKQTATEGLFGMDYLDDLAQGTGAAAKKVGEETIDLVKMLELGGRTISEKVQDDIDALREAKDKAAREFMDDQLFASFTASMDARINATAEAVERYKEIMQPYAEFVGSVFNGFVNGLAEGQSATEAFAKAVQNAVAAALASLAKEFGVKSLGALAEGFAALSNPFTAAAAPGFFKSAALYAAAAAAAGVGSAAVSSMGGQGAAPTVGGGGGAVSSSGGVGGTSNNLGGNQQSAGTPSPIVVDLRGAVFPTSDLTGAQQFGEAVARSLAAAAAGNQPLARRLIGTRGFVV